MVELPKKEASSSEILAFFKEIEARIQRETNGNGKPKETVKQ